MFRCSLRTWGLLLGVVASLRCSSSAYASPELRAELSLVAQAVKQVLVGREFDTVSVGPFTGPPNFPTSTGASIVQILSEEFARLDIRVKPRAPLGIKGEYLVSEVEANDPGSPRKHKALAVRIKCSLVDQFGATLTDLNTVETTLGATVNRGEISRSVRAEEAIVEMLGFPADLPPGEAPASRDRKLRESFVEPSSHLVNNSQVFAAPGSPYGLEVLVQGRPRASVLDDGLPFVKIGRGEIYEVRLINQSNLEVGVRLSIDGLNVFTFSDVRHTAGPQQGQPKLSRYLVGPRSSIVVKGWHRTNERVDSFLVTEYAQSAAAMLNQQQNLGTITAVFSASWPLNAVPPPDEPGTRRGLPHATGFGPPLPQQVQETQRKFGVMRASVSVRYSK